MKCRHGEQGWDGDAPRCAFNEDGSFRQDNWMCKLLCRVRYLCHPSSQYAFWNDDDYVGVIPIIDDSYESPLSGRFAVLSWYKMRGHIDGFWIVDGKEFREGNENDAKEILRVMESE